MNLHGFFSWILKVPTDSEPTEVERREIWYMCKGYLIKEEDVKVFTKWARKVDFWGRWMPEPPDLDKVFIGEYGWAPAFYYFQQPFYGDTGWVTPPENCPVKIKVASLMYTAGANGLDCSIDDGYTLRLPAVSIVNGLGLHWTGNGADFIDASGQIAAFDPTAYEAGPDAVLVRAEELARFLKQEGLALCWTVIGEKRALGPSSQYCSSLRISGAYTLSTNGPKGFLKTFRD